jgi:hypothetical protein
LPWPPSPTAVPRTVPCLSQRPRNCSPQSAREPLCLHRGLPLRPVAEMDASLRDRLNDGCGVLVPIATSNTPQAIPAASVPTSVSIPRPTSTPLAG